MKRIISAIVHDRPGVLNRVSSMFRRRGFNIASLAVGHSEKEGFSRMTIVVDNVEGMQADQITTQLDNVVEVVEAADITDHPTVIRETALIKVAATPETRGQVIEILDLFSGIEVANVSTEWVIIEMTGTTEQVEAILALLEPHGIIELMRTGLIALTSN
ncbi:MAG: acetolactate synthase small subunit [Dehalococcoidia bacterium]